MDSRKQKGARRKDGASSPRKGLGQFLFRTSVKLRSIVPDGLYSRIAAVAGRHLVKRNDDDRKSEKELPFLGQEYLTKRQCKGHAVDNFCPLGNSDINRAMVGAINVNMDFCFFNVPHKFLRDEKIIKAPAGVSVARMELHIPPSIRAGSMRIKVTE